MSPSPDRGRGRPRNSGPEDNSGPGDNRKPPPDLNLNTSMNNGPEQDQAGPGGSDKNGRYRVPNFVHRCRNMLRQIDFATDPTGLDVKAFLDELTRHPTNNPDGFVLGRPVLNRSGMRLQFERQTPEGPTTNTKESDTRPLESYVAKIWGLTAVAASAVPLGLLSVVKLGVPIPEAFMAAGVSMLVAAGLGYLMNERWSERFTRIFNFGVERRGIDLAVAPENLLLSALNAYHLVKNLPGYAQFVSAAGRDDQVNLFSGRMLEPCLRAMEYTLSNWGKLAQGDALTQRAIREEYDALLSPYKKDLEPLRKAHGRLLAVPNELLPLAVKAGGLITGATGAIIYLASL